MPSRSQLRQNLDDYIPIGACSDYSQEDDDTTSPSVEAVVGKVDALENTIGARLQGIENTLQQLMATHQVSCNYPQLPHLN